MHSFGLTIRLSVLLLEGKRGGRQSLYYVRADKAALGGGGGGIPHLWGGGG